MDCFKGTDDILQYALQCGMIDMNTLREEIMKKQEEELLKKYHKYTIAVRNCKTKNHEYSYWCTYIYDENAPYHRRVLKRATKEKLIEALLEHYKQTKLKENYISFKDEYNAWVDFKKAFVSPNTIYHYVADYKRFFDNSDLVNRNIEEITNAEIILFMAEKIKSANISVKAFNLLFSYIQEIFDLSFSNQHIKENPCLTISKSRIKALRKLCKTPDYKSGEDRTLSDKEISDLLKRLHQEYKTKPEFIVTYCVEFALLTGCRVGEIAALKWSDIMKDRIIIQHSEKRIREKGTIKSAIESTKTHKIRAIPLTEPLVNFLNRLKEAERNIGVSGEFVFMDKGGMINSARISNCMQRRAGKGINACRRTVNSLLKSQGLETEVAASILGHSADVNTKYYTYDMSNINYKAEALSEMQKKLVVKNQD